MASVETVSRSESEPLPGPFISYSRRDHAFARRLYEALRARNRGAWVDLEGIEPSEEWLKKLHSAIDAAQALVFVITEDSVSSRFCEEEIRYAAESNKKLIPILLRAVPEDRIPAALARIQWISFLEEAGFEDGVDELIRALDTDLERTTRHTRLLVRAREWSDTQHDRSLLLRGRDLKEAEQWLLDSASARDQRPSSLQTEFIGASAKLERRTRNRLLSGVTGAAVIAIALSVVAVYQRNQARANERQALSRQLAAQAQSTLDSDVGLSMLLAVTGYQRRATFEARQAMLAAMHHNRHLERFLHGHDSRVDRLAFDTPGALLASAADDGDVIVWDLASGSPSFQLNEPGSGSPAIAINAEAGLLATGSDAGIIHLWQLEDGRLRDSVAVNAPVRALAFSADGRLLGAGTASGRVSIQDITANAEHCSYAPSRPSAVTALRFDPGSAFIAAVDYAGSVRVLDTFLCAVSQESAGERGGSFATLSPNLDRAVSTDAGFPEIAVTNVRDGSSRTRAIEGTTNFLLSVDHHPIDDVIALGTQGREILLWNSGTERAAPVLRGHRSDVTAVAFAADGRKLASATIEGEVILWDLGTDSPIEPVVVLPQPGDANLFFLRDGETLLAVGGTGEATVWNVRSGAAVAQLPAWPSARNVALTLAGERYAAVDRDSIVVRGVHDGAVADRIGLNMPTGAPPVFSPDGRYLAYLDGGMVMLRDLRQHTSLNVGQHDAGSTALAFSPADGALLFVAAEDLIVFVDPTTGRRTELRLPAGKGPVQSLAVNGDATILATGGNLYDGSVRLWDLASGTLLRNFSGSDLLPIARLTFSPDGSAIAVFAQFEEVLRVFDIATGQPIVGPIRLAGSAPETNGAVFAPDGGSLATAERSGIIVRNLDPTRWIDAICRSVNRNLTHDEWRAYVGAYDYETTCPNPVDANGH